ncbi:PREDICTED: putative F-box protein At1g49610 [Camelina sativa]|uniref:F-box protein At1g49610 n=1 Tax=Camelina sativa TaxID=90675 RepID=A0ABM0ZAX6_CAMSA|nr:PREDICTED: putative F-box protein At1g49610 [Camelina sativa]
MDRDGDGATAAVRSPSHRDRSDGVDSISALPDEILQNILTSLPTRFAIRTSILSKRWRHVWCDTPCLNFERCGDKYLSADSINETLARYKARKMVSFHLCFECKNSPYIESWIEFAKSRKVENMTLDLGSHAFDCYAMRDSLYINSYVKKLTLRSFAFHDYKVPSLSVSWTSLKELSLRDCSLAGGTTMPKILSGCPVLQSLTLDMCCCYKLKVLDLSKSLRLTTLEIDSSGWDSGLQIVAPHIRNLGLTLTPYSPCDLVDVSSLSEARLDILSISREALVADFLQQFVQNMMEKLHNVEKLTFGENFIKIFSFAELLRVPLPLFNFKALTIEIMISQCAIHGVVKLLQSSRELKKLTVHTKDGRAKPDESFDLYVNWHCLETNKTWCSEALLFKNIIRDNVIVESIILFIKLVLKSTKTLENMVVRFGSFLEERRFEELLEMVPMLSHDNNNVSIVLGSTTKSDQRGVCVVVNFVIMNTVIKSDAETRCKALS